MIKVFISPGTNIGLVWNAEDWFKLRQEFRIVGDLIGSLPNFPRQDTFKGLPLSLLPEEVTLLKEMQYAKLVYCSSLLIQPPEKLKNAFEEQEKNFHESQRKQYIHNKEVEVERSFDSIIKGRLEKNKEFRVEAENKKAIIFEEVNKIQSVSLNNFLSCTFTEDQWIEEAELEESEWLYPSTIQEKLKYDVFVDLWRKNYYITCGTKFGGDFLCYPGDPSKFHATYIIVCKENESELTPKDLVMYGRVGTSTKKTVVLASKVLTEDNKYFISYQSLQWVENSTKSSSTN